MVIAEESSDKDAHDIDLKCAEKVTDSDNEEAFDGKVAKSEPKDGQSGAKATDGTDTRDFTCKPKPIKAQRQTIDSPISSYKQNSMYAFNSPKNPTGILPFQPTGKSIFLTIFGKKNCKKYDNNIFCGRTGGAFKIMPCSPKDAKPINSTAESNASENSDKRNESIPSTVFNFNTVPSINSKFQSQLSKLPLGSEKKTF